MDARKTAEKLADDLKTVTDGTLSDLLAYLNLEVDTKEPRIYVEQVVEEGIHDDHTLGKREIALIISIAARINRKINDTYKNLNRRIEALEGTLAPANDAPKDYPIQDDPRR